MLQTCLSGQQEIPFHIGRILFHQELHIWLYLTLNSHRFVCPYKRQNLIDAIQKESHKHIIFIDFLNVSFCFISYIQKLTMQHIFSTQLHHIFDLSASQRHFTQSCWDFLSISPPLFLSQQIHFWLGFNNFLFFLQQIMFRESGPSIFMCINYTFLNFYCTPKE